MCWFWRCINCLFVCLLNFLTPFLSFLLFSLCFLSYLFTFLFTSWLIYLVSTASRIDPFRFKAGGRRRRPNLALVFWFILRCSIFCYGCICLLLLCLFQFVSTKYLSKWRDWLGRTSAKWPTLCLVGCKTLTQSINHPWCCHLAMSMKQCYVWFCSIGAIVWKRVVIHKTGKT